MLSLSILQDILRVYLKQHIYRGYTEGLKSPDDEGEREEELDIVQENLELVESIDSGQQENNQEKFQVIQEFNSYVGTEE